MRPQLNIEAARAQMKARLLRLQIEALEGFVEKRKVEALTEITAGDWEAAEERCKAAAEHQAEINQRWATINELRETIDAGTTHVEEKGDFA